jgi:hypothetical protein
MTAVYQTQKQFSLFPDVPRGADFVGEDGKVSSPWLYFFDQLIYQLQQNFKPEGFVIPPQTADNITELTGAASNNNIVYDSTNNAFKGNIAGTWKTFTLT